MIYSIVLLILSIIAVIEGVSIHPDSSIHQVYQACVFIVAAVLFAGSFIVMKLSHIEKTLVEFKNMSKPTIE